MVDEIQKIALKKIISEQAIKYMFDKDKRRDFLKIENNIPNNTQLGALRMWISRLDDNAVNYDCWKSMVDQWLYSIEERNGSKNLWPSKSIPKLGELVSKDSQNLWELVYKDTDWDLVLIGKDDEKEKLKSEIWAFALKDAVDALVRAETRGRSSLKGS